MPSVGKRFQNSLIDQRRLCISVNTINMKLQINVSHKHLPTVRTVVYTLLLCTKTLCRYKSLESPKQLSHSGHLYGLSPVWTLVWMFSVSERITAFLHTWRDKCFFSSSRVMNCCWQVSHVNQVPSLCDFSRCLLSWSSVLKNSLNSVYMSIALHQCEYEHDASVQRLS